MKQISVVIPCYKEAEVIEHSISAIYEYLKPRFDQFEIIVVTDGSPDDTRKNIERIGNARPEIPLILIPFPSNQGKGAAVKSGVLASKFDPVLFIDADLTIPIAELDNFLSALETSDIAIASRLVSGSSFEEPIPWYRRIMARGFHLLQMILLGNFEFADTQCGFKLFRRDIALTLFRKITIKRFAFDAELLFIAARYNLKVSTLPVTILKDTRNTNVRPISDSLNMFFALLKIRWNHFIGRYDIAKNRHNESL
jgi:dolichyl-phosphate beta-glucosyltransferase